MRPESRRLTGVAAALLICVAASAQDSQAPAPYPHEAHFADMLLQLGADAAFVGCEAEEEEESGDVGDGGEEDTGGEGGIDFQHSETQGDEHAGDGGGELVEEHGATGDEAESEIAFPEVTGDSDDEADGESVDDAEDDFFEEGFSAVAGGQFAEGEVADDDGEGLHAGVTALSGDDGEEDGEGGPLGDGGFEEGDDGTGDEGGDEIDVEPG